MLVAVQKVPSKLYSEEFTSYIFDTKEK